MKIPYLNKMRYVFALLLSGKGSQSCLERGRCLRLLLAPHTHFDSEYPCLPQKMRLGNFVGVSHLHFNVQCPLVLPYSIDLNSNYFHILTNGTARGMHTTLCTCSSFT